MAIFAPSQNTFTSGKLPGKKRQTKPENQMAKFEIIMPKLGESIIEATITRWVKSAGDAVEEDDERP